MVMSVCLYLEVSQSVQGDTAQPQLGGTRIIRHTVLINISMFDGYLKSSELRQERNFYFPESYSFVLKLILN